MNDKNKEISQENTNTDNKDYHIKIGEKYGCLRVLDDGEEYKQTDFYKEETSELNKIEEKFNYYNSINNEQEKIRVIKNEYPWSSFCIELNNNPSNVNEIFTSLIKHEKSFSKENEIRSKLGKHYKCQCDCGKIHYYDANTIRSNPKYCNYPRSISTKHTYSVKAQNATYRKRKQYEGLENVHLLDISECIPSEEWCEKYNKYKARQLAKKQEKLDKEISEIPRILAKNYYKDYVGKQYESLYIEQCINDHFESKPEFSFSQSHKKSWKNITVYKQYKCRCVICGKEHIITCDKFDIQPPTEYGYHAYYGYWSDVYCDCHKISSFQWIVCKLLFEANVNYFVEYSFPDLYGNQGVNLLRFDFAIFNKDGSINCLIECQGEQHYQPVDEFGGENQYKTQIINDDLKRKYAKKHNYKLLEIPYTEKNIESIRNILERNCIL